MWILSFNDKGVEMNFWKDFLLNLVYIAGCLIALGATLIFTFAILWLLFKTFIEWMPFYGWILRGVS